MLPSRFRLCEREAKNARRSVLRRRQMQLLKALVARKAGSIIRWKDLLPARVIIDREHHIDVPSTHSRRKRSRIGEIRPSPRPTRHCARPFHQDATVDISWTRASLRRSPHRRLVMGPGSRPIRRSQSLGDRHLHCTRARTTAPCIAIPQGLARSAIQAGRSEFHPIDGSSIRWVHAMCRARRPRAS